MTTTQQSHPEWEKENSLTAPSDRDRENKWRPDQGAPALTETEVESAIQTLDNTDFTGKFPRVDRTYSDPPIALQAVGLVSFTPAKGATPNKDGVFGFAKLRGNYASQLEAKQRAEEIIRNIDSYHQIYHTYVGRPFPITASSKYSAETDEIDIRKAMTAFFRSSMGGTLRSTLGSAVDNTGSDILTLSKILAMTLSFSYLPQSGDALPLADTAVKNSIFARTLALGACAGLLADGHHSNPPAGQTAQITAFSPRSGTLQTGDHRRCDSDFAGRTADGAFAAVAILRVLAGTGAVSAVH